MLLQKIETEVINYLFDKSVDDEQLELVLQKDLSNLIQWCDYPDCRLDYYWNSDLNFYDFQDNGQFISTTLDILIEGYHKELFKFDKSFQNQLKAFKKIIDRKVA